MTKDEIREFVKAAIRTYEEDYMGKDDPIDEYVGKIVAKWEEDVQSNRDDARQSGIHDGQESAWIADNYPSIG